MKHLCVIFFVCCSYVAASQNIALHINTTDSVDVNTIIPIQKKFTSKVYCSLYINQLVATLKSKGYISCSIDSLIEKENSISVNFFIGKKYKWNYLQLPQDLLNNSDIDVKKSPEDLPITILNYYQNNGYPFATIELDSIIIDSKNEVSAKINIDKGIAYSIDSIRVLGNAEISQNFLQHFLQMKKGSLFNGQKLSIVDKKIGTLPYLESNAKSEILMLNKGCVLSLNLQNKKLNKFDAIIGLLPNNNQKNGKTLLTVDAKINLVNAFAKGEYINFNWQQIQPQSPKIDIGFSMPYIFKSNAQFNFNFNLYKRDSAYINIASKFGLEYELNTHSRFTISLESFSTRIIDADTNLVIASKKLPSVLDFNISNLGVEYNYSNAIGTRTSKRSGFELKIFSSFGQKKIKPNNTITSLTANGFNYASLYDSINTNTYQFKAKFIAANYFALSKQTVLKLAAHYGVIQSSNYFQNELYQIGGFKLLRGFDEENIFTNEYIIGSVEYRYLMNPNSYFYVFSDGGFTKNKINNIDHNYISTGLGLALETKQGILHVSLAAGKQNDLPFNLKQSKIHIGIVSSF